MSSKKPYRIKRGREPTVKAKRVHEGENFSSKLKEFDDYKDKRTHDTKRFQSKNLEKESKLVQDGADSSIKDSNKLSKKKQRSPKNEEFKEHGSQSEVVDKEVYDPLSKDMDNDGVIDRFDNDFRDSDVGYEPVNKKLINKNISKKRNYSKDIISWKKPKEKEFDFAKSTETIENLSDKTIQKKIAKQKKLRNEFVAGKGKSILPKDMIASSSAKGFEVARDYLSHGSDENQGVESGEKIAHAGSRLVHGIKDYRVKRKNKRQMAISKLDRQIRIRKSKLEFRDAVQSLKKDSNYQKLNALKKFQKKRHMKSAIYKKQNARIRDRIKESLLTTIKGSIEFIRKRVTRIGAILIALFLLLTVGMNSCSLMGSLGGIGSSILSSSYMASDKEITTADELMTELEADLLVEIKNVPNKYPGYDVYRYEVERIGHDPQELIAYLTAKYGEFKFRDVEADIMAIYGEIYNLSFREETEVYTVTETVETTDPETGETSTSSVEVEKTRTILITTLTSKNFNQAYENRLNDEQKQHYETLKETKGNFMNLEPPIKNAWKSKITSMYGYRADPFTGEKTFHSGLDIADSEGTPLLAVFDGEVIFVGYDPDGYGHYIKLKDKHGNIAVYAHCLSISQSVGQKVEKGSELAKMGTTGRSTGSHLHFELYLEDGTRVNPYFYLYSEEAFNAYSRPNLGSFESFNWTGGNAQETVWGYLITHGYTKEAAAGIMGNIEAESGFRTDAVEASATNPGEGIGLIQWSFGRKSQLISFAQSQGKHWSDIGVQIAFLEYEMNGNEGTVFPGGISAFKNIRSIDQATHQFCWLFERPNELYAHYDRRISAAYAYYEMYKNFDTSVVKP